MRAALRIPERRAACFPGLTMLGMRRIILPALAVLLAFATWWPLGGQHWLAVHTGTDYCPPGLAPEALTTCRAYGALSGFLSDLGEYVIITGLAGNLALLWRKHTCHYAWWCWRHPHHQLDGTPYMLCAHHHPDEQLTVKQAVQAAKEAAHA